MFEIIKTMNFFPLIVVVSIFYFLLFLFFGKRQMSKLYTAMTVMLIWCVMSVSFAYMRDYSAF